MMETIDELAKKHGVNKDLLQAVAKEENRSVIRYFLESGRDQASLLELAEYIANRDSGQFQGKPRRAMVYLHHSSLTELDDLGIIDYDTESQEVRKTQEPVIPVDLLQDAFALGGDD